MLGKGKVDIQLQSTADRDKLNTSLDSEQLTLKKDIHIRGEKILRGGRLVFVSRAALAAMEVPGVVTLQYDDMESTTAFDRQDGPPSMTRLAKATLDAPAGSAGAGSQLPQVGNRALVRRKPPGCCAGPRAALFSCFAAPIIALGRTLEGMSYATPSVQE